MPKPSASHASPAYRVFGVWTTTTSQARPVAEDELLVPAAVTERDQRDVRDREREHRSERVHRPEEVDLPREQRQDRHEAGEDDERDPRRPELRVHATEYVRELPIARHRVRDARRADHSRIRRDEE